MPFATINTIRIHYEIYGAGAPVLMINGLSAPGITWLYQVRDLSSHYQIITFDNRGVGESELPQSEAYPIALMAEDAFRLLQHLGVRRAHVVGASMGGTIAQELALRHPEVVRSLVLACTWARGDGRFVHTVESWVRLTRRVTLEERFRDVLFPMVYSPAFFERPGGLKEALIRVLAYPFATTPEGMERQARGLLAWNGSRVKDLKKIKAPTLVLVGREDILTPPDFSRTLARLIPKAKLKIIAGGHGFFIEEAQAFNRAVLAFFRRVK
ncbi:MAG: alpha/beta fold hydrolase [Candidatus Rokubacteria bacterium]|nr:alpha/beta fold hydrolase [Candidatus Rokubacteria bacterium]MBI2543849.1 alpha/beta fold hydrolase [Candidatus Rokubacteria bacterium]MBI2554085.1 alpha/beta fold hydrolase [Candidatus Rokubacteria bacterium]